MIVQHDVCIVSFVIIINILIDTIDTWDEDKLKEVVERKHGAKIMPKTEIVMTTK